MSGWLLLLQDTSQLDNTRMQKHSADIHTSTPPPLLPAAEDAQVRQEVPTPQRHTPLG